MDYFADLRDFYLLVPEGEGAAEVRRRLLATLAEFQIEIPAAVMSEEQLDALPAHVLLGWRYDRTRSLSLYAIPTAVLSDELASALRTVHNKGYAYDELTFGDAKAAAFARIDAALGLPDYDEYVEELGFAVADSDKKCLAAYRVAVIADGEEPVIEPGALDRRFVSACAVRRSQ